MHRLIWIISCYCLIFFFQELIYIGVKKIKHLLVLLINLHQICCHLGHEQTHNHNSQGSPHGKNVELVSWIRTLFLKKGCTYFCLHCSTALWL